MYKINKITRRAGKVFYALVGSFGLVAGLLISSSTAFADTSGVLSLTPSSQTVTAGSNLTITVSANAGTNTVNAVQTTVSFSSSQFTFVSVTAGAFSTGFNSSNTSTSVNFSGGSTSGLTGTQTAATIVLQATGAGTSAVTLSALCSGTTDSTCSTLLDSTSNTNDLGTLNNASYTVNAVAPSGGSSSGGSSSTSAAGGPTVPDTGTQLVSANSALAITTTIVCTAALYFIGRKLKQV